MELLTGDSLSFTVQSIETNSTCTCEGGAVFEATCATILACVW